MISAVVPSTMQCRGGICARLGGDSPGWAGIHQAGNTRVQPAYENK
eukprot:gene16874-biopygen23304